jgi:hypothetical protein
VCCAAAAPPSAGHWLEWGFVGSSKMDCSSHLLRAQHCAIACIMPGRRTDVSERWPRVAGMHGWVKACGPLAYCAPPPPPTHTPHVGLSCFRAPWFGPARQYSMGTAMAAAVSGRSWLLRHACLQRRNRSVVAVSRAIPHARQAVKGSGRCELVSTGYRGNWVCACQQPGPTPFHAAHLVHEPRVVAEGAARAALGLMGCSCSASNSCFGGCGCLCASVWHLHTRLFCTGC